MTVNICNNYCDIYIAYYLLIRRPVRWGIISRLLVNVRVRYMNSHCVVQSNSGLLVPPQRVTPGTLLYEWFVVKFCGRFYIVALFARHSSDIVLNCRELRETAAHMKRFLFRDSTRQIQTVVTKHCPRGFFFGRTNCGRFRSSNVDRRF